MTNKELIAKLSELPDDAEIVLHVVSDYDLVGTSTQEVSVDEEFLVQNQIVIVGNASLI